tara:strand:+ start:562 stop:1179 length:618 start_codon:yes stop_codon:yes gene_type:complete
MIEILNILNLNILINFFIASFTGVYLRFLFIILLDQYWLRNKLSILNFSILPTVGYLITSVISNNIALSLGMVGALSIVRFRTPIKNPFELVCYFCLITAGIVINVDISILFNFLIFITVLCALFYLFGEKLLSFSKLNYSENDPALTINTLKKIENIPLQAKLVHNSYSGNEYRYILYFQTLDEINNFLKEIDNKILSDYSIDT